MYVLRYAPQVCPAGGTSRSSSDEEQVAGAPARPVVKRPSRRYVKGETLHMNFQNPGIADPGTRIL